MCGELSSGNRLRRRISRAASDRDYRRLLRTGLRVELRRAATEIALAVAQAYETVREQPVGVAFD
jgi:hypothetical protein